MATKNFVFRNLEWNDHHSRHHSSAGRVPSRHPQPPLIQYPLRLESIPESSQVKSSTCDGLVLSSPRRHSPIRLRSADNDDSASPSSSKDNKPVIEYRRQPRNSALKNDVSRCDRIAEGERIEMRENGSVFGDKGSRQFRISIPIQKKNGENNDKNDCAMEAIEEERKQIGIMAEEEGKEILGMGVGVGVEGEGEGKDIGVTEGEEEGNDVGVMEVQEEGNDVEEELVAKTWNLRPRNQIRQSVNLNGGNFNFGEWIVTQKYPSQKKQQVRKKKGAVKKENSKKRCLTVALTKEEIKEDLALLGIRTSKKPRKRSKSVQKLVDNLYVGAALDSVPVTADLYTVSRRYVGLM